MLTFSLILFQKNLNSPSEMESFETNGNYNEISNYQLVSISLSLSSKVEMK